jgi:hypothetical protein
MSKIFSRFRECLQLFIIQLFAPLAQFQMIGLDKDSAQFYKQFA